MDGEPSNLESVRLGWVVRDGGGGEKGLVIFEGGVSIFEVRFSGKMHLMELGASDGF